MPVSGGAPRSLALPTGPRRRPTRIEAVGGPAGGSFPNDRRDKGAPSPMNPPSPDESAPAAPNQPADGLALWDKEAADVPRDRLPLVRLDQNERYLVPFTTSMVRVSLHYLKFESLQGHVMCNGPGCPLCGVGQKPDVRDLVPVYDVLDKAVGVLAIGPDLRAHALRPAIQPVLRRVAAGEGPILLIVSREGYKYLAEDRPLPAGADDGAAAILAFRERFDAGRVDLTSPYQRMANEDMAAIGEVRSLRAARGIDG